MAVTRGLIAVSYCLPPMLMPRSIQVSRLLDHTRRLGWDPVVVTPDRPPATLTLDPVLDRHYHGRFRRAEVAVRTEPKLAWWRALYQPWAAEQLESAWIKAAVARAKDLIRQEKPAALVTFGQPWSDHLVGLALKRRYPALPWIAHFSDPWVDSPYHTATPVTRKAEADVAAAADALVFTNTAAVELVMGKYPAAWRGKTHVLPHALEPELTPLPKPADGGRTGFRLAHVGNLFTGRLPDQTLYAVAMLRDRGRLPPGFILELVANQSTGVGRLIRELGLREQVRVGGAMPYGESLRHMASADALLLIDGDHPGRNVFLPSKIMDYLAVGRPILGATPADSPSHQLLADFGQPSAAPSDRQGLADALSRLLAGEVPTPDPRVAIERFGADRVARQFCDILDGLGRTLR